MENSTSSYSVVFGGGGCRTFWGMGVLSVLDLPQPREWAGVSAGAAMATISSSGRQERALERFVDAVKSNRRNMYLHHAVLPKRKVFPHEDMYRETLHHALDDEGWDNVQQSAPIRVFMAYVEEGAPVRRTVLRALNAYRKRSKLGLLHGLDEPPPGLATETATLQHQAESPKHAVDLILTSSATWPITPFPRKEGRTYIDGGAIDGLPLRALSDEARNGKVMLLMADPRPAEELPDDPDRMYLAPEDELPVTIWDYANHDRVLAAYERGQKAGEKLRPKIYDFLQM